MTSRCPAAASPSCGSCPGPPGAPTILLLHGWTASADLNWFACYAPLARHYRVLAIDHRGHGRGIRTRARFRLADCADDAAALIDQLGTGPVIAVGYSMGGPIAQLLWHRHRDKVAGLVLCATTDRFSSGTREGRAWLGGLQMMARMARLTPDVVLQSLSRRVLSRARGGRTAVRVGPERDRPRQPALAAGGGDRHRTL